MWTKASVLALLSQVKFYSYSIIASCPFIVSTVVECTRGDEAKWVWLTVVERYTVGEMGASFSTNLERAQIWNELPKELRMSQSYNSFKKLTRDYIQNQV